jgi:hypothetical protein
LPQAIEVVVPEWVVCGRHEQRPLDDGETAVKSLMHRFVNLASFDEQPTP